MRKILPFVFLLALIIGTSSCNGDVQPPERAKVAAQLRLHIWWEDGRTAEILVDTKKKVWNTYLQEPNWTEVFSKPLTLRISGDYVTFEMRQPEPGIESIDMRLAAYWHSKADALIGRIVDLGYEEDEPDINGRVVGFPLP